MRSFTNRDGELILSWTVIDREIRRRLETGQSKIVFAEKESTFRLDPTRDEFEQFSTTLWDVPKRGSWGVHQPTYRGNWAPQIARALLEMYSRPGDLVLDPFMGGGTTLIEALVLGRNALGFDVSPFALEMTAARLRELREKGVRDSLFGLPDVVVEARCGYARELDGVEKQSIDFICTHPPYGDALKYTEHDPRDLSRITEPAKFLDELAIAGARFMEVLKPGGRCAILIGDLRRELKLHALGFECVGRFKSLGFDLDEVIIKPQHRDRSTEFYFKERRFSLRLAHEYLLVFKKDGAAETLKGDLHERRHS
jgi:DNA modification methylase